MFKDDQNLDLSFKINCDSQLKKTNHYKNVPESHFVRSKVSSEYLAKKKEFSYGEIGEIDLNVYNFQKGIIAFGLISQNKYNEVELVYTRRLTIRFGELNVFMITYVRAFHHISLQIDPEFNREGQNKELFSLLTSKIDQLELTFFEENDYYYVSPDDSVVKDQVNLNNKKKEPAADPHLKRKSSNSKSDFSLKMNQISNFNDNQFLDLIGKRVILSMDPDNRDSNLQGTVMMHHYGSKKKEEVNLVSNSKYSIPSIINIEGMLVPMDGLRCSSKSIFSIGKTNESIRYYHLTMSVDPKDLNLVHFNLKLQGDTTYDKVQLVLKNTQVELTNLRGNYIGYSNRSSFKASGMQIKVLAGENSDTLFDCYPEKSHLESSVKDLAEVTHNFKLRMNQSVNFEEPIEMETSNVNIGFVFFAGLLVLAGILGGFIFYLRNKKKKGTDNLELEALS